MVVVKRCLCGNNVWRNWEASPDLVDVAQQGWAVRSTAVTGGLARLCDVSYHVNAMAILCYIFKLIQFPKHFIWPEPYQSFNALFSKENVQNSQVAP